MWEAWQLSNQWKKTPSSLYGIQDPLAAHNFDKAVMYFGTAVEADINQATEKAKDSKRANSKAQAVLEKWLSEGDTGRFRDPISK